ncbi:MAG: XRE family transcriptional regulator [Pseudomonadota bacterium]|nr:XRE family transcriptional regulator [Pseudomonadota bacterium]
MQDAKQQFAQKLSEAMVAAGYAAKPSVLEREFNTRHWGKPMSLHGVRRWLRGETVPDARKLRTLCEWLGVSAQDLLGFDAPPAAARAPWAVGLGYQERELFELFLRLPVPARRSVREVILAFAAAHRVEPLK